MRKVLIGLTAFVVLLTAAALPAQAGISMEYVVTIDPTSGETGTDVTFTPTDLCPAYANGVAVPNAPGDRFAAVALTPEPSSASDFVADAPVDDSGDWSITYTIPDGTPEGDLTFYAFCLVEAWPDSILGGNAVPDDWYTLAHYAPVVFTVTAPPPSTTTTSTTSTTVTPTTTPAATLVASPTTVEQGGTIKVEASGFKPGTDVVITLQSDPVNLGTYVADSAGRIATNVVVPADFPTGSHTLTLTGTGIAGNVLVLTTGITVASRIQVTTAAPTSTATTTSLPATGSSFTGPALAVAGVLVLGGAVAVVAARRRAAATR